MKHIKRFSFIVAALFLATLTTPGCKKEHDKTTICDRIEGVWKEQFSPHAVYSFSDGQLTQRINFFAGGPYVIEYAYECDGDKLTLEDINTQIRYNWIISFENDTTLVIQREWLISHLTRIP